MATRIHAALVVSSLADVLACSSQLPPAGLGHRDGGAPPDALSPKDGGRLDDASITDGPGDGAPTLPLVGTAGACTVDLQVHGALSGSEGTLPTPGPYRPCRLLGGHRYTTVRLSGDGRRVAALTTSGVVIVLDSHTLERFDVLARNRGAYTTVAVSGDGTIVAAGSDVDGEVDVWRVTDHTVVRAIDLPPPGPTLAGVLALSTDGARVATVAGTSIVVVDAATGATRSLPASRLATALYFVDGDRKIAFAGGINSRGAGTGSTQVELIDIETGAVETLVQNNNIGGVDQLEVSADGNTVLVFGSELSVWDAATARKHVVPKPEWVGGTFGVFGLSADGTEFATSLSGPDGERFQRRRTSDGAVVDEFRIEGISPAWHAWSSRESLLVTEVWDGAGETRLLAVDTAAPKVLANACAGQPPGTPVGFSDDGKRLVVNGSAGVKVFDVETGAPLRARIQVGSSWPDSLTISPDGRRVAWTTGDADVALNRVTKRVYMADAAGGERHLMFQRSSPNGGLAVLFAPDSQRLAVVDVSDAVLSTVDIETGARTNEVSLGGSYASPLAVTSDGDAIVILDDQQVLRTVRWRDGATVAESTVVGGYVSGSPSGTVVTLWGAEAHVYRDGALLSTLPGIDGFCLGFTPYASLSRDGAVVGLGMGCRRPSGYDPPHSDIRETATGALIQQVAATLWVLSPDASRFADEAALIWCR